MYRARSVQQLGSQDSKQDINKQLTTDRSKLALDISTISSGYEYDNAKLKASSKGKTWLQPVRLTCQQHSSVLLHLLLLLVVAGLWVMHARIVEKGAEPRHLVVLDAGSTGTRVHVFQYAAGPDPSSGYVTLNLPEPKLKVQPGLSAYATDAAGAAASLQPLLEFAAQHVPAAQQQLTPVYLMATAGLRLLQPAAAESILDQCRSALLASTFLFKSEWAQIISGTNEGLYAWVAANYAAGHLQAAAEDIAHGRKDLRQSHSKHFKALIEMGGASAQVTFMPDVHEHGHAGDGKHSIHLKLPGVRHPLWSHSYLGYGFDVVQHKVEGLVRKMPALAPSANATAAAITTSGSVAAGLRGTTASSSSIAASTAAAADALPNSSQPGNSGQDGQPEHQAAQGAPTAEQPGDGGTMDPCLPAGYRSDDGRVGSGVWQQCQQLVSHVIDPSNCQPVHGTPCPELPQRVPKLTGELLAIENFAYTAQALSLPSVSSLGDFATAARQFCSRPWPQTLLAHSEEPAQQQYLWRYCFGSALAWTLLHQVLQISEGQQLHFTNVLTGVDGAELGLDWALGAAILQLSNDHLTEGALLKQQQHQQRLVLSAAILATAALMVAVVVAVLGAWRNRGLSLQPQWLTVVLSPVGGGSGGGERDGDSSWSSMAASAWANAASQANIKPVYSIPYQHMQA